MAREPPRGRAATRATQRCAPSSPTRAVAREATGGKNCANGLLATWVRRESRRTVLRWRVPLLASQDIKPENVLFTGDRVPKLADMGLAIDMGEERPNSNAGSEWRAAGAGAL
jgi:hypothetical protein